MNKFTGLVSIPAGKFTSRVLLARDRKQLQKSDLQGSRKQKKRCQSEQLRRTRRGALREAEGVTYEADAF